LGVLKIVYYTPQSCLKKKKQGKQWENDAKALESGVTQLLDKPWWFHILLSIQLG
jgi:hypothetical protein